MSRYGAGTRFYVVLSGERPVYRAGRLRGIAALHLRPGAQVLDIGCGTRLNLEPVLDHVDPSGGVLGVDRSPAMLARVGARVSRRGRVSVGSGGTGWSPTSPGRLGGSLTYGEPGDGDLVIPHGHLARLSRSSTGDAERSRRRPGYPVGYVRRDRRRR